MGNSPSKAAGIAFIVFGVIIGLFALMRWWDASPSNSNNNNGSSNFSVWMLGGLAFFLIIIGIILLVWDSFDSTPAQDVKIVHTTAQTYPPIVHQAAGQAGTYPAGVNHRVNVNKTRNLNGSTTVTHTYAQEEDSLGRHTDPGTNLPVHGSTVPETGSVTIASTGVNSPGSVTLTPGTSTGTGTRSGIVISSR